MSTESAAQPASTHRAPTGGESYDDIEPLLHRLADLAPADPEREPLRQKIIGNCLPLGQHIARRYTGRGVEYEDLAQIAAVGVVLAVDRFDPTNGASFLGFAVPTIMGEVKRYFRDSTWAVRVPRRTKELQQQLGVAIPSLSQTLGREPTARELAEHLQAELTEITQALIARNSYTAASLDAPQTAERDGTSLSPINSLCEIDPGYVLMEDSLTIGPLLAELPDRDRALLIMRYGQEKTQAQIAKAMGVSQMQVSRLLTRILTDLRAQALQAA
ncbi:SigB/SigF/SigG family RNA polymerase sigma factor [Nocardia sp. NPDC056100]|uniref:SigB/SigF/SigG family RNA polymerase sigma factor n=1 Tax=Nocardia sp. NPDC056100 TaxID=3345712 RepID=UPI0035DFFBDD